MTAHAHTWTPVAGARVRHDRVSALVLPALLVACGDDRHGLATGILTRPDAQVTDAPTDTASPDAPTDAPIDSCVVHLGRGVIRTELRCGHLQLVNLSVSMFDIVGFLGGTDTPHACPSTVDTIVDPHTVRVYVEMDDAFDSPTSCDVIWVDHEPGAR